MKKEWYVILLLILITQVYAQENLDVRVNILEKELNPDQPLRFQVDIFRLGEERKDIYIEYFIKEDNNLHFIKSESIAIEKMGSFIRTAELPRGINLGLNALFIKATLHENTGGAVATFKVLQPKWFIEFTPSYTMYIIISIAAILLMFSLVMILDYRETSRILKVYKKIGEHDLR